MRSNSDRNTPNSVRPRGNHHNATVGSEPMPSVDASESESESQEKDEGTGAGQEEKEAEMQEECNEGEGGNTARIVRSPGTPSQAEREQHNMTHWPYRSWCEHCNKGRGVGQPHRSMKGEYKESTVARVLMDYGYLHEDEIITEGEHENKTEARISMTTMVMLETLCSSVWAYVIDSKGSESLEWLAKQVVEDIETVGLNKERIITKADQEASIIQLQKEVARQRTEAGTAIENSRVGDSNSNGKIERAIREVKGLVRTMRSALEEKIQDKIRLDSTIVPWLVRHAGYVITRCRIGEDGKTAMQRLKGRKTNVPWVEFGETVMFKLPKVPNMPGDFQDRFESGIWLGCTVRSGEHLIGTAKGVHKVSSVLRKAEDRRWSAEAIKNITGSPMEPVPGTGSSKITAFSKKRENTEPKTVVYAPAPEREEPEIRVAYIYKKDVEKHGPTPGCPGCRAALNPAGSFRAKHTPECRKRFEEEWKKTEEGKKRVERAEERMDRAVTRKFEEMVEKEDQEMQGEEGAREDKQDEQDQEPGDEKQTPPCDVDKGEAMEQDKEELEAAPQSKKDKRVPLDPREPAQKRSREPNSPKQSAKFQAIEETSNKRSQESQSSEPPKWQAVESEKAVDEVTEGVKPKFGQKTRTKDIKPGDMVWKDIGSGTMARTFKAAKNLRVSTKGGPPASDVERRIVYDLQTGKVIDDCVVDDAADQDLYRELEFETDIRVELILKDALSMYEKKGADVVELFSPPRIAQEAAIKDYGGTRLKPGWSLDLTRNDPKTGEPWDLSDKKVQSRIVKMVAEGKPLFLIGSPPCTAFSAMLNLSKAKRDEEVVKKQLEQAKDHVRFCLQLYQMQLDGKRYFVHEHPATATSWRMPEVIELMMHPEVGMTTFDMCRFGMTAEKDGKEGPVQKTTRVISNSREVLKRISLHCPNKQGHGDKHNHIQLEGGLTKKAQVYPRKFCQAVCEGVAAEKRLRALGLEAWTLDEISVAVEEMKKDKRYGEDPAGALHEEDEDWEECGMWGKLKAVDDVSGEPLDPEEVRKARKEEIRYFKEMNVYKKVPLAECWAKTGKAPIGVRWVDVNKGDSKNKNYRSRLVAKEYKTDEKPEWFAATPPSECLKIILSKMASDKRKKLVYADVSRAYFYAAASRAVYVTLTEEDQEEGDEGLCGKLNVSMYGTRDAATNWAEEYSETLKKVGYRRGVSNPCLFWHPEDDVTIMVHGDDFVAVGEPDKLEKATKSLKDRYKIKTEVLGTGKEDVKEVKILNKVIRLTEAGLEFEADPRHAELIVRELELQDAKPAATPGCKETKVRKDREWKDKESDDEEEEDEEDEAEMGKEDATKFRGLVARLNYIAPDRADIQFAVKEAARSMASPKVKDWRAVVRIGKYLKGKPRMVIKFGWQKEILIASTYSDSDWAGCKKTGKSTSGGVLTIGRHVVKSYSRQQKVIALSSAEAELHAMVMASAETLGLIALCQDMGVNIKGDVYVDSSAALGVAQRKGHGKVRHLRVQALWVQEVRCNKRLKYIKVLGTRNPSDILTKHVPKETLEVHLRTLGIIHQEGRASVAPSLDLVEAYTEEYFEVLKGVHFSNIVLVRPIPATGKGMKCRKNGATKRTTPRGSSASTPRASARSTSSGESRRRGASA